MAKAPAQIPITFGDPVADFTEQGGARVIDATPPAAPEFPNEQVPVAPTEGATGGLPAPEAPPPVTAPVEQATPAPSALEPAEPTWHGFTQSQLIQAGWTDKAGYAGQPGNYLSAEKFAAKLASQNDVVKNALQAASDKEAKLQATIEALRTDIGGLQQSQNVNAQAAYDRQWDEAMAELSTASADFDEEGVQKAQEKLNTLKAAPPHLAAQATQTHWAGDEVSFNTSVKSEMARMGKDKDPVWRSSASRLANFMAPADYASPADYVKAVDDAITREKGGTTTSPTPPGPMPTPSAGGVPTVSASDGKTNYTTIASLPPAERAVAEDMWLASDQSDRAEFDKSYLASVNYVANQPKGK